MTFVTKLSLAAKAAFVHKTLCFEVLKILFGLFVDRMLENKSLHERLRPPPPPPAPGKRMGLWCIVLALPVKNGPLFAELKFKENIEVMEDCIGDLLKVSVHRVVRNLFYDLVIPLLLV